MNQSFEIAVTLKGKSLNDVLKQAQELIDAEGTVVTGTPAKTAKTGKRAAAPPVETDDEELLETEETTTDDDDTLSFDSTDDEETEIQTPPAGKKTPKITDKDVNSAAIKHAKKHGREETLKVLQKKFKVKSILELKPDQFASAIAALKV